jgi:hypothetical protein
VTTIRRWHLLALAVAALGMGMILGAQITHHERANRDRWEFPCKFEDEARITYVPPGGNKSICIPTDDIKPPVGEE